MTKGDVIADDEDGDGRMNEMIDEKVRNERKTECSKLTDKIGEITDECSELMKKQPYTFDVHDVPGSLQTVGRYIDELTTERDEWKAKALNYEHRLNVELACSDKSIINALELNVRELEEQRDALLRCLENDYGIKASWDGLRKVWFTEIGQNSRQVR